MRRIGILLLVVVSVWLGGVLADRQRLREDILRLHVVGASDSAEDQQVKLRVRDAVLATLEEAGNEAYLVGGCVRDLLRGVTPHDYDAATSARP